MCESLLHLGQALVPEDLECLDQRPTSVDASSVFRTDEPIPEKSETIFLTKIERPAK
jgi:hypothetical protein